MADLRVPPPTPTLSALVVDTHKNWNGYRIENVGAPTLDTHVPRARASDILSGRFTMARMPDGEAGKILAGQGLGVDPAYMPFTLSNLAVDVDKDWGGRKLLNVGEIYKLQRLTFESTTVSDQLYMNHVFNANVLYATKTAASNILFITSCAINLNTALTGNIRLGIYRDTNGDGYPDKLLFDLGEFVNPGTGWQTKSLPSPYACLSWANEDKPIWFAVVASAAPTLWARATSGGLAVSYTYGALPDPFPSGAVGDYSLSIQQTGLLGRIIV